MRDESKIIYIATVGGSFVDLRVIDLSPWNIQGGMVESYKTEHFFRSVLINGHDRDDWEFLKETAQEQGDGVGMYPDWEIMNLLWPINFDAPPTENDYFEAIEAIRVIYPSEIYIRNIIDAQYFEDKIINITGFQEYHNFNWSKYENPSDYYFNYSEEGDLQETNRLLACFKANSTKREYIKNAINYYSDSFRVNRSEMSFICLCICLETLVPGKDQPTYRFRRSLAVLCSNSIEEGRKIYKNANKLYDFRSKLVHSALKNNDLQKLPLYFDYAKILASRMIVEMLLHDLPTIEDLDNKITEIGYGQKNSISENYIEFNGNSLSWNRLINDEL